ncbi:XYPPX repeat family protein [Tritrichomonas foetus]|uniref:Choline transporter-like protein n=1 Tax=Tritrichomonas foetus TaxID=1144522 RepID=A0A1J4JW71_9EUKA|nr:XYPPX repeat family protein [Tritrichomonas foetus]|eukprot:OHT02962.1 XYPPX repeat family protein [Tritrichomonas foetus]
MTNNPILNQPLNSDPNYHQHYQAYQAPPYAPPTDPYGTPNYGQNYGPNPYQEAPSYQPYDQTGYTQYQQPYQQQYQQNSSVPPTYNYDYDPYNIQYRSMQIDNWNQIPPDPSPYSQMWANPQAFEPQSFSTNTKVQKKYNDLCWLIFFWINFIATIALIGYLFFRFSEYLDDQKSQVNNYSNNNDDDDENNKLIYKALGIGIAIGVGVNIIHYCYATFAPVIYIKMGMFIGVIVSILCVVVPVIQGYYYALIFPLITTVLTFCMYCCMRRYIKLSAAVMAVTTKIICRYPTVLLLVILQSVLEVVISVFFSLSFFIVEITDFSRYVYIYLILSFFWITITFGYVTYMTGSGLAASWYFLNNTEYFPKHPVWESFKRASTTSFGSASLAGFLLAVIKTLEFIIQSDNSNNDGDNSAIKLIVCLLKCIALCILKILEACFTFINRYALIYCAVFGVPFKEGCRRWAELSCHRFCNVLLSGCCIGNALSYNGLIFTLGSGAIGFGIGCAVFGGEKSQNFEQTLFTLVFAVVFTFAIFAVYSQPIITVSDTILVCFSEAPEKLKTSANELYENLKEYYHENVDEKIRQMNK